MTENLVICLFSEQRYIFFNLCNFLGHSVLLETDNSPGLRIVIIRSVKRTEILWSFATSNHLRILPWNFMLSEEHKFLNTSEFKNKTSQRSHCVRFSLPVERFSFVPHSIVGLWWTWARNVSKFITRNFFSQYIECQIALQNLLI